MKESKNIIKLICLLSALLLINLKVYAQEAPTIEYEPIKPVENYHTEYPIPINSYQTQGYNNDNLRGKVVMVPASTTFTAVTTSPISSEYAKMGDKVVFYLGTDFYYKNHLIASQGSKLNGTIIRVKKGSIGNKYGQVQIKFTNITTPTGQMIPVAASILTNDGSGILKAGTAKDVTQEYVKTASKGAALGAILGTAIGALSSGGVGKGAIYGTIAGGGTALINTIFETGGNVEVPQNVQMDIILDQPITVSSNNPY